MSCESSIHTRQRLGALIAAWLGVALVVGCGPDIERVDPNEQTSVEDPNGSGQQPAKVVEQPEDNPTDQPPPPTIPEVKLTESLQQTNKVGVGDNLPDAELPDLQGQKRTLAELFGEKLTVVVFWQADDPYSTLELEDLQKQFLDAAAEKGVKVVALNVGDQPEAARDAVAPFSPTFPILLDTDGAYFAQVATEHLPRTYLVDPTGKILWFDLEYSSSTRRQLDQAIEAVLLDSGDRSTSGYPSRMTLCRSRASVCSSCFVFQTGRPDAARRRASSAIAVMSPPN